LRHAATALPPHRVALPTIFFRTGPLTVTRAARRVRLGPVPPKIGLGLAWPVRIIGPRLDSITFTSNFYDKEFMLWRSKRE
jgi:hypothetical protein